jgi:hypothetical protein
MSQTERADGSSELDAREIVQIDRTDTMDRMRYRCPNGHTRWDPTNNHIWCKSCSEAAQQGADVHPEHWEILDKKTGEEIPWSAVEFV